MRKLEVFYDYVCPFCMKAHMFLKEIIGDYPDIEIDWRPCEAHPRPETYGPHSDLCIQGMFFAQTQGIDLWEYHDSMYKAALVDRVDVENIEVLSKVVEGLLDAEDFRFAIEQGEYWERLQEANDYAYEHSGVWAVPAYRLDGKKLDAVEGIGVTQEALAEFLAVE